jgi:hypothetical protein
MYNLIGYPLREALKIIEQNKETKLICENLENENNIINIKKILGTNNKFNDLKNPYVIRCSQKGNYVTLCISYY